MPKSASTDSQPEAATRAPVGGRKDGDRVHSNAQASTSPRCGFKWVDQKLKEALEQRRKGDEEMCINGFDEHHYSCHAIDIHQASVRHIIGTGGRMLRKIEDFCGVFIIVGDCINGHCEIILLGLPSACILGEFIIEMLEHGYFSIIETLVRLGW